MKIEQEQKTRKKIGKKNRKERNSTNEREIRREKKCVCVCLWGRGGGGKNKVFTTTAVVAYMGDYIDGEPNTGIPQSLVGEHTHTHDTQKWFYQRVTIKNKK